MIKGKAVVKSLEVQGNVSTTGKETFTLHQGNQTLVYTPSFTLSQGLVYEGHQKQKSYYGAEKNQDSLYVPDLDDPVELEKLEIENFENKELLHKVEQLSKRLRLVEQGNEFYGISVNDLSLVPKLVKPAKFRAFEFDKYDGTKCLKTHLRMYCHKMHGYEGNQKLLIHCF
ncbi:hypothetical protein PTKIN_Ptkin19aG0079900 [Pterospermum kingtungense]